MSRNRGVRLQNALADYLRNWWSGAESAGSGRKGRDVLGTPGVWWENKAESVAVMAKNKGGPAAYVRQAQSGAYGAGRGAPGLCAELPVVVWWPPGVGAERPELAIAMLPLPELMDLVVLAEYAPARENVIL